MVGVDGTSPPPCRAHRSPRRRPRRAAVRPAARPVRRGAGHRPRQGRRALAESAAVAHPRPRQPAPTASARASRSATRTPSSPKSPARRTTTRGPPTRWSGRCSRSSTPAATSPGARRWPPTSVTSRPAKNASCGRAGVTRWRAASPVSSLPTPASGRSCSSTGKTISPVISLPTCNGSRPCGAPCSTKWTPTRPTFGTRKPLPHCRSHPPNCPSGCRCSDTPGCRRPRSNCSTPWPPITTSTCGCRTPATTCGKSLADQHGQIPRRDDTSHRNVGHPLLATLGRDLRELQRSLPTDPQTDEYLLGPAGARDRPDTLLGWLQSDITANAVRPERPNAHTD